jgi:hypothetical protein
MGDSDRRGTDDRTAHVLTHGYTKNKFNLISKTAFASFRKVKLMTLSILKTLVPLQPIWQLSIQGD